MGQRGMRVARADSPTGRGPRGAGGIAVLRLRRYGANTGRRKAEGGRQKAEGRRQKAEGEFRVIQGVSALANRWVISASEC
ncbi:MAG: hypothetical protein EA368_14395 [Leptolyngbya sp. DLM2.Bin27]|nr:MAG: hypothetical protein EA368_14395 [Leptolyngbya sp. DLM2.Bin27]